MPPHLVRWSYEMPIQPLSIPAAVAFALALCAAPVAAQKYPAKVVRVVVPFPAGGPSDFTGRLAAQKLTEALGVQVIVDNRPGGSGLVGTEQVARAAPDGYTLLNVNLGTFGILPHMVAKLPFDPVRDFAPITLDSSVANPFRR